jgi:hypothetical protein
MHPISGLGDFAEIQCPLKVLEVFHSSYSLAYIRP